MDHIRGAYAALGLPDGSSYATVRRRYRALVKTWHPDRFAADPQGQAEANLRMRVINAAHMTLMQQRGFAKASLGTEQAKAPAEAQRSLSREEVDAMVEAIGSEGPVDSFLGAVGWVGSTIRGVFAALFVLGFVLRLAMILLSGKWGELLEDPQLVVVVGMIVILGLTEYLQRRRLTAVVREQGTSSS